MIKLNVHEANTYLSEYLAKPERTICKHNRPIAEIRPIPAPSDAPRPIGLAKDIFEVTASFFEPFAAVDH